MNQQLPRGEDRSQTTVSGCLLILSIFGSFIVVILLLMGIDFLQPLFPGRNNDDLHGLVCNGLIGIVVVTAVINAVRSRNQEKNQLTKQYRERETGVQLAARELRWDYHQFSSWILQPPFYLITTCRLRRPRRRLAPAV